MSALKDKENAPEDQKLRLNMDYRSIRHRVSCRHLAVLLLQGDVYNG